MSAPVALRFLAVRLALLAVLFAGLTPAAENEDESPLLRYAAGLHFDTPPNAESFRQQLARAEHQLERNPMPETGCARTLGAGRFSGLLDELGDARASLGDYERAIDAYRKALACTPRASYLHADLAAELMHAGRFTEARQTAQRGLAIDRNSLYLTTVLAQLDIIEEKWTDASERLRTAVISTPDPEQAAYWQCFLWLTQRRGGVPRPQLADRELPASWGRQLLEALQDRLTEDQLLETVQDESDESRRRELLSEALYYMGQKRLVEGETELAGRYFTATSALNVVYFIEHYLALAELAKLRK